ncbi:heme biosynthesis protein HemY [Dinoroseobacter sp. S375]|uniref:heme biosynthesis protein HemY n=1 Tax=Dinoroseobacter sp. S375 TaxID=3415136 RepID=UPI003C7E7D30
MLWSLIKILIFVAMVAALTFGATFLMDTGEQVRIAVASTEFTLSPVAAVVLMLLLLLSAWLLFKAAGLLLATLKFLNGDETAVSRYFSRGRERKGFEALAQGMMALASGEGRVAMAKAARAERYLGRPDLTSLLTAQAAELAGDRAKAAETYKTMLTDERTKFAGVRGLLSQRLADGDTETAMALAEKAFALKPRHTEVQDTLLRLQASDENWSGARKTLAAKLKTGDLPRDVHKRRDAVLAVSEAMDAMSANKTELADALVNDANRMAPGLVPSAAMAARVAIRAGKPRQATKLLKRAWELNPHPELAAAYAEIAPDETAAARIKRFEALIKPKPNHVESRLLMAELFIAAEDFPAARKALGDLYETAATARSLTIMAAVEKGEGSDDAIVRAWLAKAVTASRGPQWTCGNCNNIHAAWVPVCDNCGAFDALSWVEPPQSEIALTNSTEMLPLIVGAIEDKSAEPAPEDDVIVPEVVDITPSDETGDPAEPNRASA